MTSLRRSIGAGAAAIGLLLVPLFATADEPNSENGGISPHVVGAEKSGLPCVGGGGRVSKCDETVRVVTEHDVTVNVKIAPMPTKSCQATISTSSEQRNTFARVEGTIEIADCTACSGGYTIVVRVRDESGETKSLEFEGSWQRTDKQPVKFTADYPIGANVDLLGVRSKGLHCACADAPAGDTAAQKKE